MSRNATKMNAQKYYDKDVNWNFWYKE